MVQGPVIEAWRRHLRGERGARAALAEDAAFAALPIQWRDAVDHVFDLLEGWSRLTGGRAEGEDRVLETVLALLDRTARALAADGAHPANQPAAREFLRIDHLDDLEFVAEVPAVLDRVAREVSGGGPWAAPLLEVFAPDDLDDDERTDPGDPRVRARVRRRLVVARWEAFLATRVVDWERGRLFAALAVTGADLRRKREAIERLTRILGAQLEYLSVAGDWSRGFWQPHTWEALEQYADLAESNPSVRGLAARLGRYEADRGRVELEQVTRADPQVAARVLRGGRSEVRGVRLSDDLDRLCASDLALLAHPRLELLFYVKYAEKRLATYEMEGRESFAWQRDTRSVEPRSRERERGPVLLVVDTSASMAGEAELVAKTIVMAVLRIAMRERRPAWLVAYSGRGDLREQELTRFPDALPALLRFLSMSFRGGTDPEPALEVVSRRLAEGTWERADVLWVTDGVFTVGGRILERFMTLRARRPVRVHSLVIGEGEPPPFSDVDWRWSEGSSFATGAVQLVRGTGWARAAG